MKKTVTQVGVAIQDAGGTAIVTSEHRAEHDVVTAIETLPFDVDAAAARVAELTVELPQVQFVIDNDGLGSALWEILYPAHRKFREVTAARARHKDAAPVAWLYEDRGLDRQRLVNVLLVAMNARTLFFAPNLAGMDAMTRALVTYKRQVKEDGLIGAELVIALCLATFPRLRPARYQAYMA